MSIVFVLLLTLFIIYFILDFKYETFLVVGYNNSVVPNYTIKNIFDNESELLNSQFSNLSIDKDFNTKSFTLFNTYLEFPFTTQFNKLIMTTIKTISKHKISLGDFNNIYYLDDLLGNRFFILNVDLRDSVIFTSRNIKVKIVVHNINSFIDQNSPTKNYIPLSSTLSLNSSVIGITLDKNGYVDSTMLGIDKSDPNFYLINNNLHLMDPFITSGIDMIITPDMKKTFSKSLAEHQQFSAGMTKSKGIFNSNSVGSN